MRTVAVDGQHFLINGARTQEADRQAIRELVARDKNHPCVVIWSIANEPDTVPPLSGRWRSAR